MRDTRSNRGRKPKGRHPDKRLSALLIRATSIPGRYADGNGLYLVVDASGAKRWVLRTLIHGKRSDLGLGGLSLTSLAEAREEATRLRKIARDGGNPLAERRHARRVVPTFALAATSVHASHAAAFKNEKHKQQWINTLTEYALPFFGPQPVNEIESAEVLKALSPIWLTKPETARRVRQRIKVVFDWCKAQRYRPGDNPVDGIARALPKQRNAPAHHAALPYAKVPAFIQALRHADAGETTKLAFEFLILTATRTNEVLLSSWPEIDLDTNVWTIPAARMKSGREHRVPLSLRCVEIVKQASELGSAERYVFGGRTAEKPLSNMVFLMILRRVKRKDVVPHGFRSSFRDWCAERTNVPRDVAEAALAHVIKDKTEAAYHRTDLFERRRELMQTWSAFATATPADVVQIRA